NKFLKSSVDSTSNFSTNITKFSFDKEEKELYLRLTQAFRENLKSNRHKPEIFYDNLIKSSILETSKILEKPNPVSEIFKTEETNNIKANIYLASENKDINKLRELYQKYKKLSIADEPVYKEFIISFIKDEVETAKAIYEEMRNNGVLPTISTLVALIKATMNTPAADYYVKEIEDLGLQFFTKHQFHVLLNYYISKKDAQGVQSLWQEMLNLDNNSIIDFKPNSYSYVRYIGFLCKMNLFGKAIKTLYIMENEGIRPFQREFLDYVIQPLAMNKHPQVAWQFLSFYRKRVLSSPSIYSNYYSLILEAFVKQNDLNAARRVLVDMELTGVNFDDKAKEILVSIQKTKVQFGDEEAYEYGLIPDLNAQGKH
ncbi:12583_t:CDS:1, partial [Funneliformis geosporum]